MPFLAKEHIDVPTKDLLSWYFDDPEYNHDDPVYIDAANKSRSYTARQAREVIEKLCAGFKAAGLKKGDVVCLHSFNDVDYPIIVNGVVAFGGIFCGTNPSCTPYEIKHAVKAAQVKFFIVEPELVKNVLTAAEESGIPKSNVLVFEKLGQNVPPGMKSWRTLLEHGKSDWERFDDLETAKNTDAARLFSSGTTGLPKAAVISHYNLIAQYRMVNDWKPKPFPRSHLIPMPCFHVAVAPGVHFSPLRNGRPCYIMRRFELEPYLRYMSEYKITEMGIVPPIAIVLINSPHLTSKYPLKHVRSAGCGAAPLDRHAQERLQRLLPPDAPITQVWGMTETTCIATLVPYPTMDDTGSVGIPCPSLDMKLVDDAGNDITDYDVRGELCVRGPTVIRGYLGGVGKESWDEEGYFHTGDIAFCKRENGYWYIVDRKKELIKVRGFQVAPPELEAVLLSHPSIVDAGVIGIKSSSLNSSNTSSSSSSNAATENATELPRAYIVRRPNDATAAKLSAEDVMNFVAEKVAKYKWLEGGIVFVNEIPKNPSGKILKRVLREWAEKEVKTEGKAAAKL
ncbi:hypothetical protein IWX49DRAFT_586224 [Phyllosticta citricarpa]|uniref:Uncharacterized protein n=2 Tax=Phyllosticta TaxID=121621 RepID=A0ABR1L2H3_9PEZI